MYLNEILVFYEIFCIPKGFSVFFFTTGTGHYGHYARDRDPDLECAFNTSMASLTRVFNFAWFLSKPKSSSSSNSSNMPVILPANCGWSL